MRWLGIAVMVAIVSLASQKAVACDAQSPDLQINQSATASNPAAGAFSGVWQGTVLYRIRKENAEACVRIRVAVVDNQNVAVMYCIGSQPALGLTPACQKYDAKLDGNEVSFTRGSVPVTLKPAGASTLSAEWHQTNGSVTADLHREP